MRDFKERPIQIPLMTAIQGAVTSAEVIVPFDCELVRCAYNLSIVADAHLTFDILKNGIELPTTNRDLQIPDETLRGEAYTDGPAYFEKGSAISFASNTEQTAASNLRMTAIIKPA